MPTWNLPVALTAAELEERASELAKIIDERAQYESELKEISSNQRARIKTAAAKIERLGRIVRERKEMREVEVQEARDKKARTITTIRLDTGEPVGTRPMTDEDAQGALFADAAVPPGPAITPSIAGHPGDEEAEDSPRMKRRRMRGA